MLKAVAHDKFPNLEKMITKELHLDDAVDEGIKKLSGDKKQGKPVKHARDKDSSDPLRRTVKIIVGPNWQ